MKLKPHPLGAALGSLLFLSTQGFSAEITWGNSVDMSADTDVSTNGELRLAINAGAATDYTVNGVPFTGVSFTGVASAPTIATSALPLTSGVNGTHGAFGAGAP